MTALAPTTTRTQLRRFTRATRLVAAGAMTAGAMMLAAPAAHAIPESTISSECDSAGGTYTTTVVDGKRYSRCCYRDINGTKHCDHYKDGQFSYSNLAVAPQETPPLPPPGNVVGPAPAATAVDPTPQPPPPGNVVGPRATAVNPG